MYANKNNYLMILILYNNIIFCRLNPFFSKTHLFCI